MQCNATQHHTTQHNIENFMIGSMEVPREDTFSRRNVQDEIEVKEAEKQKRKNSQGREMSPPCILSLDDEFKQLEREEEGELSEETLLEDVIEEGSDLEGDRSGRKGSTEGDKEGDEEENWHLEEELRLQEDMMAVRMEVEMMQKEKEGWEEERKNLTQDKAEARAQREALEQ